MMFDFPAHWQLMPLEETMDALIDYRGKTPTKTRYGIPLITAKIVKGGRIHEPSEFISEDNYDSWMVRGLPKVGDVVVTTEAPLGEIAQLDNSNVALAQRIVTLRGKNGLLNNDFLLYAMQSDFIQHQLESRASGSTVKGIKQSELRKVLVPIPPENEQIEIAKHLKSIDQKIALNRQINQTLESMAQTIFKSWFVDFEPVKAKIAALKAGEDAEGVTRAAMRAISGKTDDKLNKMEGGQPKDYARLKTTAELFPAAMQDSELGEVPEGWEVKKITHFGSVICGKTPPKINHENYGGGIPFVKIPDMHGNVFVTNTNEYLSVIGENTQIKKQIPKGSVCISCIATVGLVSIAATACHTNQQINSIVPTDTILTPYLYFSMLERNKLLHDLASGGSTTLNLNTGNFAKIELFDPSSDILKGE